MKSRIWHFWLWIFEVLVELLPWCQPTVAIFRLLLRAGPPALSALDKFQDAQPLRRKNYRGRGPLPLPPPTQWNQLPSTVVPSSTMMQTFTSQFLVPLRKTGGVTNAKVILLGFGKHDNGFLVAPSYVLLKIILEKCLYSLAHIKW